MILYAYYFLLVVYSIFLVVMLVSYVRKPAPGGDASVGWALGILYSAALAGILLIVFLLRKHPAIGLVLLCLPLVFIALPILKSKAKDMYARLPSVKKVPLLTLHITNGTAAVVHVQLNCWFRTSNPNSAVLYKTLDYIIDPLQTQEHQLANYETGLLATKSKYISIVLYECVTIDYQGHIYRKDVQPCMQFWDETIEAFQTGIYRLVIDGSKNISTFKQEVETLKGRGDYGTGVF